MFYVDGKGVTANNEENTTIQQYLRQHLYPMRAKLAGREREGIIPIPSKARGIGPFCASLSLTRKWTDGHMNKPLEPRPKVRLHPDLT